MQEKHTHRYFHFSRRERRGIYVLLLAITVVFASPSWLAWFFPPKKYEPVPISRLPVAVIDSAKEKSYTRKYYPKHYPGFDYDNNESDRNDNNHAALFYFDPNTLSAEEWEKLGVRPKTIQTIQNYLSKGGRFSEPEDIDHIFGLSDNEVQRLLPYVRIEHPSSASGPYTENKPRSFSPAFSSKNNTLMLNINNADTLQWKLLPGIGPGYARRIVNYRNKLGGFHSIEQVAEVYGMPDSVFQKIKPQLQISEAPLVKININTATAEALMEHPYISKNLARLITGYRQQHGPYKSLADLKKLALVSEDIYLKINTYLSTE